MLEVNFHPVVQTRSGAEGPLDQRGNCHAACLASIFGVTIDTIPEWGADKSYHDPRDRWLFQGRVVTDWQRDNLPSGPVPRWTEFPLPKPASRFPIFPLAILAGRFPTEDELHAVVYSFPAQRVIWDPNPDGGDPALRTVEGLQMFRRPGLIGPR